MTGVTTNLVLWAVGDSCLYDDAEHWHGIRRANLRCALSRLGSSALVDSAVLEDCSAAVLGDLHRDCTLTAYILPSME
jgi:hypothetical protein